MAPPSPRSPFAFEAPGLDAPSRHVLAWPLLSPPPLPRQPSSPSRLALLLAAAGLAGMGAFVAGVVSDIPLLRLVAKPVPVLCLALHAAVQRTRYAAAIAVGLVLGAAGDVLLEASPRLFVAGLAAFLVAHVAYIAAFAGDERRLRPLRALPAFLVGVPVLAALWPGLGEMRVAVTAYMLVICAMGWRAAARVEPGRRGAWLSLAGAALFLASDAALGIGRFLGPFPGWRAVVLSTYWAAQLFMALSASSARTPRQSRRSYY